MRVGYAVAIAPDLASYRLRVQVPASKLSCPYIIGATGSPTFFYKSGNYSLARSLKTGVVYDVVNDHFAGEDAADYHGMVKAADMLTVSSPTMAEIVRKHTGRDAVVIDDPYENDERPPECKGDIVLWFGHAANLKSLYPYRDIPGLRVTSNTASAMPWSRAHEDGYLKYCAICLLTGNNVGASANRVVKAIRAGRFVVAPPGIPAWDELRDYCWIGDVREGVKWALNNREDACLKVAQGQRYMRERFNPSLIGAKWTDVFGSISGAATKSSRVG